MTIVFASWLMTQYAQAAPFSVAVANPQVELGKPLRVTLTSMQNAISLNAIDLQPWQQDFVVARERDLTYSDDRRQQRLRLQVYPLRTGRLSLPALQFLDQRSSAVMVEVAAAKDTKTGASIDFACHHTTLSPWQRQQVIVSCRVTTRDAYIQFAQAKIVIPGLQILPMQVQGVREQGDGERLTRYEIGWVLLADKTGELNVQLPPIQYLRESVPTHLFYPPPLTLQVRALPGWLPGTIPVGEVELREYRLSQSWLTTGKLTQLHLQFLARGMTQAVIPEYALQLRSDERLQYYTAQQDLSGSIDAQGIQQHLKYTIPLLARHSGVYQLPRLRLQYFDPDSGTLKTQLLSGPRVIALNRWLRGVLWLLALWLALRIGRWLWRGIQAYVRRARAYRLAMQQLRQADSLPALRQVMQTMARAEGLSDNFTYQQWQEHMQGLTAVATRLAVGDLNAASYGRVGSDITPQLQVLSDICRQRRFALV